MEARPGLTPSLISDMHPDEIYAIAWDRKTVVLRTGDIVVGTSGELARMGVLPKGYKRGKSVAAELIEAAEAKAKQEESLRVLEARLEGMTGRKRRRLAREVRRQKRLQRKESG